MPEAPALLARLERVKPSGEGWSAQCPAHQDGHNSLTINVADDGRTLVHCHAGCAVDAILDAAHLERRDLFPNTGDATRHLVATYDYRTPDEQLSYQVVRYAPKDFRQRRPDGNGGWDWSTKGTAAQVYRRPELQGHPTAIIAEGEKDVDRLWALGLASTCNHGGAGNWRTTHTQQLVEAGVTEVVVIPDADAPGQSHAQAVARSCAEAGLTVQVVPLPDAHDVAVYLDAGATKDDLAALIESASRYTLAKTTPETAEVGDRPVVQSLSGVKREAVSWIWPRRFPRGKLVLIGGEPGEGKSTMMLDVTARITQGGVWPDGGEAPHGSVLLLSAEDGLGDTIAPRLDAAGADSSRVHALTAIRQIDGTDRHLDLGHDVPQLEAAIQQVHPLLVIIDPLSAYLGRTDTWKDSEVRALLSPLAALAERHGCTIAGVMHLSKTSGRKALHRLMGSIGFSAAARVVLAIATDPDDDTRRLLLPVKNNLTRKADTLAFTLGDGRVAWDTNPVEGMTADSVLNQLPADKGEESPIPS